MTTADFRAQARAVRAATQLKLMELRRNRRAASRHAAKLEAREALAPADSASAELEPNLCGDLVDVDLPATVDDDAPELSAPSGDAETGEDEAAPVIAAAAPPVAREFDGMTISSAAAVMLAAAPQSRRRAEAPAAFVGASDAGVQSLADMDPVAPQAEAASLEMSAESAETDAAPTEAEPDPTPTSAEPAGDLATLPDLGPGLIWLLGKAGVDSVAALRDADPDALAEKLGIVGRLVDVRALKALAATRAPR